MAYVDQTQDENEEGDKLQSAAGTTLSGYSNASNTAQDRQSGMQTNLNEYIDRNKQQTGQMTQDIAGRLSGDRESALSGVKDYASQYGEAYKPGTGTYDFSGLSSAVAGQGGISNVDEIRKNYLDAIATKGKGSIGEQFGQDYYSKVNQAQQADKDIASTATNAGRMAALQRIQGQNASSGVGALNQLLSKNDPNARNVYAGLRQAPQAGSQIEGLEGQAKSQFDAYKTARDAQRTQLGNLSGKFTNDATKAIEGYANTAAGKTAEERARLNAHNAYVDQLETNHAAKRAQYEQHLRERALKMAQGDVKNIDGGFVTKNLMTWDMNNPINAPERISQDYINNRTVTAKDIYGSNPAEQARMEALNRIFSGQGFYDQYKF